VNITGEIGAGLHTASDPTPGSSSPTNTTAGLERDPGIDLGAVGWLDALAIVDGLQLLALEQHRQAVLTNDEETRSVAPNAERHADQLRERLEARSAASIAERPYISEWSQP